MVKKLLIGVGVFVILIIVALAVAPVIFKDQIKEAVDTQLEASVNADIQYNIDNFSVSFFTHFPNLTAGITDLAVIGREPFAGKTLFAVREFALELNLWKLLGSEITVEGIYLDQPEVFIRVLEDGTANYDIAISEADENAPLEETETGDFRFAVSYWEITNGHLIYDDATFPIYVEITDLNHTGSGDFTLSVFDLDTYSHAFLKQFTYDGISYMENRSFDLDMILNMDLDQFKFTFKENELSVNDFSIGFDGWLAMPDDDIDMDLTFASKQNTFKSLISLIPAIYAEDFENLETAGEVILAGSVKGTYNDDYMPAYKLKLEVSDGMFHYPELPESIKNVQINMTIDCQDGIIEHTVIDLSRFYLEFGKEPMAGYFKLGNLVTYPIDLEFNTSINLANINYLLPIEGLEIKGAIEAHLKAAGQYDSVMATIPKIEAELSYKNGAIRYADVPAPIDQINMVTLLSNKTGKLNDTRFAIPRFAMNLDGSPISGNLLVENFDNIHWQTELAGNLNFDKLFPIINKLYPMPGTKISGSIQTKLNSEGHLDDVENENYGALATSGEVVFNNFIYTDSVYLPQGFAINSGAISFDPKQIKVTSLKTKSGSSDFNLSGSISNYLAYVLTDELLTGQMQLTAALIDVNEFMTDDETTETTADEAPYSVIAVPENIDFVFRATVDQIKYDKLILNDARGRVIVKDGELRLDELFTKTLGGSITFNGSYNTTDINKPRYSMALDVKEVGIASTYQALDMVKALAPIAKDVTGNASSNFRMSGLLQQDMMPDLASLTGMGKILVAEASLRNSKLATGLTGYLKSSESQSMTLKDIAMAVSIVDGKLKVEPFNLRLNNTRANISGMSGLDGSLDYTIKMEVPAGQLGTKVNALLGSITGNDNAGETIKLSIGLAGSYDEPKFNLLGTDGQSALTQKAGDLVKENTGVDVPVSKEELKNEALEKAQAEADKILAEAQKKADQVELEAKKSADQLRQEAKAQSDKLIKEAGSNVLKKTAAEIAGKKLVEEADVQAAKVEAEGKKQAEGIMAKAKEKADAIIASAANK